MDEEGGKHSQTRDKDIKGGVSIANTGKGGQKHAQTKDQKEKGGVSMVNKDEGRQKHTLPMMSEKVV